MFLNLIVQNAEINSIKSFVFSLLEQKCKDFRIIFNRKNLNNEQMKLIFKCQEIYDMLGLHNIVIVDNEEEIPHADMTKHVISTSSYEFFDKLEILKLKIKYYSYKNINISSLVDS